MARILIVDDDIDIIEANKVILEAAGHEVISAMNKTEGMQAALNNKPELMILDVMMDEPDDGFALAQDLRSKGIQTPIIMLTSVGRVTGMDFGVDEELLPVNEFIQKPVDPAVLQAKVKGLLS